MADRLVLRSDGTLAPPSEAGDSEQAMVLRPDGALAPANMRPPSTSEDVGRAAMSGAKQGLVSPLGAIEGVGSMVAPLLPGLGVPGMQSPGLEARAREFVGDSSTVSGAVERAIGAEYTPQTAAGRYAQAGMRGVVSAGAMVPLGAASLPSQALLLAGGATGELGAQAAKDLGMGELAQMGTAFIAGSVPSFTRSMVRRGGQAAAARRVAQSINPGAAPKATVSAARELRGELPGGNVTEAMIQKALAKGDTVLAERLAQERSMFRQAKTAITRQADRPAAERVTTAQALSKYGSRDLREMGGEGVEALTEMHARNPAFRTRLSAVRNRTQIAAERAVQENLPQADPRQLPAYHGELQQTELANARAAYDRAAPLGERQVRAAPVAIMLQNTLDSLPARLKRNVPQDILTDIEDLRGAQSIDVDELDAIAGEYKAAMRSLATSTEEGAARRAAVYRAALPELEASIDEAVRGRPELHEARSMWRSVQERFDPETVQQLRRRTRRTGVVQEEALTHAGATGAMEAGENFVGKVMNPPAGTTAEAVARELKTRFRDDPQARDAIERGFLDHIHGDVLTPGKSVEPALKRMRDPNLQQAYRVLFGRQRWARNEQLLRQLAMSREGRAGTVGQVRGQGSSNIAEMAGRVLSGNRSMRGAAVDAASDIMSRIRRVASRDDEVATIIQEALLDPEVAKDLLRIPTGRDLAAWEEKMLTHLARAAVRSAALQGGR